MLLDKLEIKGFKSFGDKVVFHFHEGITGVVGPNGSGKSNVVDAIRWVLGEQRARALRSDKMDNVIFNGTKSRKQLQMAEVAMTFKNTKNLLPTEYTEVTIARRYYRSGEGEYLLNGITCRLKDIHNLFMDTGIGSDSYAIIELKMVDEILNDQNNSRRGLFEEAAGISKFKQRKKETVRKLEDTDADLARVDDLLFEIQKNLKTLERQAKQAANYLKLKEDYKKMSVVLAVKSVSSQVEEIRNLADKITQETTQKTLLNAQIAQSEALLEKNKTELINKEKLLASRQKTLNDFVAKIRQYESENKIKSARIRFLTDKSNALQRQLEEDIKSNERAKFSIEGLQKEKEQTEKMLRETEFLLEQYKKDFENQQNIVNTKKNELAECQIQLKNKQTATYQLKKSLEINQVQQNSLKQELDRQSTDTSQKNINLVEFDKKIILLSQEITQKKAVLLDLESKETRLNERIESLQKSVKTLQEEFSITSRTFDAKQNEYSLTKSMVDSLEGYPQAIVFLKKNTTWSKNAVLLSDIITCDEKYRIAVENYLEPYLSYYVVENEEQAIDAVNLLADAAKGKANFFITNKLEKPKPAIEKQYENAVPALSIVEYDRKYTELVYHLLYNVYVITKNQDVFPADNDLVFISQNGKIIKRKHTISGGSVGLFEGKKIGRAKNLEKLSEELKELDEKITDLQKLISDQLKTIELLQKQLAKKQIEDLKDDLALLQQEEATVKAKKEQFAQILKDAADKSESLIDKIAELKQQYEDTLPKVKDEEAILLDIEDRTFQLADEVEKQNELLAVKSNIYNQQNILFHQQANKLESIKKEIEYKQTAYEKSTARIEVNQNDLKTTQEEIKNAEAEGGQDESQLVVMYQEKETIEQAVNEAEKDYYNTRGIINETEKNIRDFRTNRENTDSIILQLQQKISEKRMQITAVKERVSVEFETDLEKAIETQETDEDFLLYAPLSEQDLRAEVIKTRQKMDSMGAINYMAIEAYEEVKQRNDFIQAQKDDLLKAKESLQATITEIETVAKEHFLTTFNRVRTNFIEVFRSLFTPEDSCDLTLVNQDDPLDSPIDIIARPKGKRPLTINQLSGGEKTLTAIALLFAIYLIKPAPFCIFDEVDAPLDDANIDKFNNIIKKFSANSQFIIVTHNKRTMASTDVIYGVTMIEQGISTVVPVDLRKIE
jgi:chromosome segregation protein